jgi:hypothetical protein
MPAMPLWRAHSDTGVWELKNVTAGDGKSEGDNPDIGKRSPRLFTVLSQGMVRELRQASSREEDVM